MVVCRHCKASIEHRSGQARFCGKTCQEKHARRLSMLRGICIDCSAEALPGLKFCAEHREVRRLRSAANNAKEKAKNQARERCARCRRSYAVQDHVCGQCARTLQVGRLFYSDNGGWMPRRAP